MNYDDWKLASPEYDSMVSSCCGADYEETLDAEELTAIQTWGQRWSVLLCQRCEYLEDMDWHDSSSTLGV